MRSGSISWHENAASKRYEATTWKEFKYDNINNKIFNLISEIKKVSRKIEDDTLNVNRGLNKLMGYYENVNDYDDYISDMKNVLNYRSNDLNDINDQIMNNIKQSVTSLINKDEKFINDLDYINQMMKRG